MFVSQGYFYEAGGWNQNTRFDLTRAIVERGTIRIDDYFQNSGDLARFGGHVYSDKAPGASLAAVPAVALVRDALIATGHSSDSAASVMWLSYVATLAAAALPATFASLCLFWMARRLGASHNVAAFAALSHGLATPLWAYATLFWSHALTAACLMAALLATDLLRDKPSSRWRDVALGAVVGLATGWAVVTEFPAAIPATIFAGLALRTAWHSDRSRVVSVGTALAVGAGLCATVLLFYQSAAFGSPFHVSYASEENSALLQAGFFGITLPKMGVMAELLWGSYRGLLPLSPALVVAPIGLWMICRHSGMRWTGAAAVASVVYYFLLNSAYEHWEGGASYGPRHLGAVLGFLCLGIVPVLMRGGRVVRAVVLALALSGAAFSLIAVSTTPQPPADLPGLSFHEPFQQFLWPAFREGELSINRQSILDALPPGIEAPRAAWNLGQKMGLTGHASLVPLIMVWALAGVLWWVADRSGSGHRSLQPTRARKRGLRNRRR